MSVKLCPHGVLGASKCKPCRSEYNRSWATAHPEKMAESRGRWRKMNPDKVREYTLKWRRDNPDKFKANVRRQTEKHYADPDFRFPPEWYDEGTLCNNTDVAWFANLYEYGIFQDWPRFEANAHGRISHVQLFRRHGLEKRL